MRWLLGGTWILVAAGSLFWGLDYYLLPLEDRAFSADADLFSPTGLAGHGYGIVGTLFILVGVVGYSVRKRVSALHGLGPLRTWLQVHIFLCTLGPWLVLLHTTFKFGGIVAIAFWSMAAVVASGVFGRYVYVRIPKTVEGRFLEMEAVRARASEMAAALEGSDGVALRELEVTLGVSSPPRRPGLARALGSAVAEDLRRPVRRYRLARLLRAHETPPATRRALLRLFNDHARLRQQALLLQPFQRLFRYWHVVHLPLALVMLLVLTVHVGVAILFGYTWIF